MKPPSSKSSGAFTYTSGNQNLEIVSGNKLLIVGIVSSLITATQSATTNYLSDSSKNYNLLILV